MRAFTCVAIALIAASTSVPSIEAAFAQAGSTGGTIGHRDKSISGGVEETERRTASTPPARRASQPPRRREASSDAGVVRRELGGGECRLLHRPVWLESPSHQGSHFRTRHLRTNSRQRRYRGDMVVDGQAFSVQGGDPRVRQGLRYLDLIAQLFGKLDGGEVLGSLTLGRQAGLARSARCTASPGNSTPSPANR